VVEIRIKLAAIVGTVVAIAIALTASTTRKSRIDPTTTTAELQRYYPAAPAQPGASIVAEFPATFDQTVYVRTGNAAFGKIGVRPLDATPTEKSVTADGTTVYSNGFNACDVVYRSTKDKTEEFLYVRRPTDQARWSWELEVGELKPVLLRNGAVELFDQTNMPRLQIAAPEGKDASGKVLRCGERLHVELGSVAAGRVHLTLTADLSGMEFPVAIDPSWTSAAPMNIARADHTATLLNNGKVLVCGGQNLGGALNSAELFDPTNGPVGTWTTLGATMTSPRFNHIAVLLNNGKVLIAGGNDGTSDLSSAEIFDPTNNTFAATLSMSTARQLARAVLLNDGTVLVVGGGTSTILSSAERFNPAGPSWSSASNMNTARMLFSATLLPNGQVLIAGGTTGTNFLNTAEIYDPTGNTFTNLAANMITGRYKHQAILKKDQSGVLLIGGFNNGLFPSVEIFDVAGQDFDPTGSMTKARTEHHVVQFSNGKVLASGCHDGSFAQVDLFDPASGGTWGLTGSTLTPHTRHTLTLLADGRALVAAGFVGGFSQACEIYNPGSEPISQSVSANASNPLAITLQASTIDDAGVSFLNVSTPVNGTLSGNAPNLVYTSNPGYSGSDSFTFQSADVFGTSLTTGTINITVNSLIPTIGAISPDAAIAGSPGFTLIVNGTNFVTGSVVRWNGSPRPTTFVNTTQLKATISATDVSVAGPQTLTVLNPTPGGGSSVARTFNVLGGPLGQWIVTTTADSGMGSLRMAMNDARNGDNISFDTNVFNLINSDAATVINLASPLPPMDKGNVTIDASNVRVTVNGSGAGTSNGIQILSNGNSIFGLTLVGFTNDGILISAANSNLIGGDRTLPAVGTGPNGKGLRIAGCGQFGIEISGGNSNVIKGCWIGVDASGSAPQSNLAGILIQNAGSSNQVGSTVQNEANVVSGNQYEGITVSGVGTNNNLIMGNIVGGSATVATGRSVGSRDVADLGDTIGDRSSVGNGSAGVFLSKGTTGTQVGGDAGQGNAIGYNGSNGVEVHASASKFNTSKHNGISLNHKHGIALFDGSNNNIQPPNFNFVYVTAAPRATTPSGTVGIHIDGTAAVDGTIEVFNDPADQGGSILGRTNCTAGTWSIDTTADSTKNLTATITDSTGNTSSFALFGATPGVPTPVITSPTTVSAIAGMSFAYTITAGGAAPITFQASNLPDGLTLNGNLISGTPTTAGSYMVHITASNSSGSTSITLVLVVLSSYTVDTDGDGVPDWLEILAGTDPNNAASFPTNVPLSVDKVQIKLSASSSGDSATITTHLTLPAGVTSTSGTANILIGNFVKNGLNFGGKSKGSGTTTIIAKPASKGSGSASVTISVKKDNLKASLAPFGLVDTTTATTGIPVTIPIAFSLTEGSMTYVAGTQVTAIYKAKKGKGGTAKK
jgi:hypothetical protein